MWFPNLDIAVEKEVTDCLTCQAVTYKHEKEPLVMSMLPNAPWDSVKIDFLGRYHQGTTC